VTKPPDKYLTDREAWSVEDHVRHQQTGVLPLNPAFADYVRDVAEAAELAPADLGLPAPPVEDRDPETLSVAEHVERLRVH
jgi:hypothetical protein